MKARIRKRSLGVIGVLPPVGDFTAKWGGKPIRAGSAPAFEASGNRLDET
jgi:hypothetical protein